MKQLAQQIRNELRIARRDQAQASNHLANALTPLRAGYYDGRAKALQSRRRVLGYLYRQLRASTQFKERHP